MSIRLERRETISRRGKMPIRPGADTFRNDRPSALPGRAGAGEVAVAVGVVDSADRGPELALAHPGQGISGLLARVGTIPLVGADDLGRVRRVDKDVARAVGLAVLELADFLSYGDHRLAEAVELGLGLALGRLDHQRAGDRERDRRGV